MRPVEYFLCHEHHDRLGVIDLEGAMRRRGLASWRDRKSLLVGDGSDEMIRAGIEQDTSGFAIFGSDRILGSDYVWNKEWPCAHDRHEREEAAGHPAPYRLIPLLVDHLSHRMLTSAAVARGYPDPMTFNGESLKRGDAASRDALACYLLRAALADRTASHSGPLRVRLTTFAGPNDVDADLLIDWEPEFANADVPWSLLIDARDDLKNELSRVMRPIEVDVQARLTAAFAFGHAFPLAARIPVTAVARDGARWALGRAPDPSRVRVEEESVGDGNPAVAVLEVSMARLVSRSVPAALADLGLHPGRVVRIGFARGVSTVDANVAAAATASFGHAVRRLRDAGVRDAHIFLAAPASLALLLGVSVNAGPSMTLYYTSEGAYRQAIRLPS